MYKDFRDGYAEIRRGVYQDALLCEVRTVLFLRSNNRKFTSNEITSFLREVKEIKVSQGIACNSILYSQRVFSPNVIYLPFC